MAVRLSDAGVQSVGLMVANRAADADQERAPDGAGGLHLGSQEAPDASDGHPPSSCLGPRSP